MSTGNTDRIRVELERAVTALEERYPGYREALVEAAMDCITATAEHDGRKTNINQRFDGCLESLSKAMSARPAEARP